MGAAALRRVTRGSPVWATGEGSEMAGRHAKRSRTWWHLKRGWALLLPLAIVASMMIGTAGYSPSDPSSDQTTSSDAPPTDAPSTDPSSSDPATTDPTPAADPSPSPADAPSDPPSSPSDTAERRATRHVDRGSRTERHRSPRRLVLSSELGSRPGRQTRTFLVRLVSGLS